MQELTSPRLIKSHLPYRFLPSDLHNGDSKVIYMARNPKDLVVSYYQFHRSLRTMSYRGTFQEFCRRFMNDKCECYSLVACYNRSAPVEEGGWVPPYPAPKEGGTRTLSGSQKLPVFTHVPRWVACPLGVVAGAPQCGSIPAFWRGLPMPDIALGVLGQKMGSVGCAGRGALERAITALQLNLH
ncbi:hypothetical protein P7K49_002358 [Saguinus oedipus]|uniref:Sulfotransferase n=1 Tax=Saguinus oedipus TaxID=9490 RepID=A0ABQ9WH38_SAGOE|nr:hypothetical protein P7K49_002358 [Saguinus oedipus]